MTENSSKNVTEEYVKEAEARNKAKIAQYSARLRPKDPDTRTELGKANAKLELIESKIETSLESPEYRLQRKKLEERVETLNQKFDGVTGKPGPTNNTLNTLSHEISEDKK